MPHRTIHSAAFIAGHQIGDFQDRVYVILAVIVVIDDLVGLIAVEARFPAVVFQVAGDAEDGVGVMEQIDASVAVAVLTVSQDVAGHELGDAQGAGVRSDHRYGIHLVQVRVGEKGFEFIVGPVGFAVGLFIEFNAADAGFAVQLLVKILPGFGLGERGHGREGVDD